MPTIGLDSTLSHPFLLPPSLSLNSSLLPLSLFPLFIYLDQHKYLLSFLLTRTQLGILGICFNSTYLRLCSTIFKIQKANYNEAGIYIATAHISEEELLHFRIRVIF